MANIFVQENLAESSVVNFKKFNDTIGLPVPLNQAPQVKYFVSWLLSIELTVGLKVRWSIFRYLWSNDCQKNPINYFFLLDQANGIFMGLNIFLTLMALLLPYPISSIIGYDLCNWADLFGCVHLIGSGIWNSVIAIIRELVSQVLQNL